MMVLLDLRGNLTPRQRQAERIRHQPAGRVRGLLRGYRRHQLLHPDPLQRPLIRQCQPIHPLRRQRLVGLRPHLLSRHPAGKRWSAPPSRTTFQDRGEFMMMMAIRMVNTFGRDGVAGRSREALAAGRSVAAITAASLPVAPNIRIMPVHRWSMVHSAWSALPALNSASDSG